MKDNTTIVSTCIEVVVSVDPTLMGLKVLDAVCLFHFILRHSAEVKGLIIVSSGKQGV